MEADGFSKPYDPAKHKPFAAMIQGEAGQQVGAMQNGERSQEKTLERSGKMQDKSWQLAKRKERMKNQNQRRLLRDNYKMESETVRQISLDGSFAQLLGTICTRYENWKIERLRKKKTRERRE